MYKKFFMGIAAMAALTLVSCSSDDLNSLSDNSSKNEAISFDGYLGRSAVSVNGSRGSVLEKKQLQESEEGFGVFGNYSSIVGATPTYGDNWFKNQKVTYSTSNSTSTKWAYTNTKYWPTEGHIDFLAYAPYDKNQNLTNNSKLNFIVSSTVTDQKDLLWANAANKTKADNPVKFTFNHALAKIGYTVKTSVADAGTTIMLNKITLAGSDDGTQKAFYPNGIIDLSTGVWTPSKTDEKLKFEWFTTTSGTKLTTTAADNAGNYLFVIPQNFSASATDKLYVIVEYTINYNNSGVITTMTNTVSKQIKMNFLQGKAYTINLTIGLTPIEFDAGVTLWTDGDKIDDITWN